MVLICLILILGCLLGFLVWKNNRLQPIKTISQIEGVKLLVNNQKDMREYLRKVGFWQRDDWEGVEGGEKGKRVKKLTVVLTSDFVMPFMSEEEKGEQSAKMRIEEEEMIVWIQLAKRSAEENQVVQKWFIKMLVPAGKMDVWDVFNAYVEEYKERPSFFKLI